MSLCIFDHDGGCANMNVGELFGKRCIEADNLLKNEQTLCKHHYDRQALYTLEKSDTADEAISKCRNKKQDYEKCIRCDKLPRDELPLMRCYEPEMEGKPDNVNHPGHYCQGGIECIKAIEASMTPEEFQGYCKGNVMKYVWRFREKNGLEDLKKAQVYLGWMIESKEKQEQNTH